MGVVGRSSLLSVRLFCHRPAKNAESPMTRTPADTPIPMATLAPVAGPLGWLLRGGSVASGASVLVSLLRVAVIDSRLVVFVADGSGVSRLDDELICRGVVVRSTLAVRIAAHADWYTISFGVQFRRKHGASALM
ncbi:hypothetical protein VFPBJ_11386 [Purpureocillium lilacinum]|uniref:Uncharacterized protein n=1 Tax=Purpureocillium lilacinum TaxID=33203 RepID=A0A179FAU2_PURLI|nr:hypothetical protein VFPBJ_11386 [Purpureocillium lilacinum]